MKQIIAIHGKMHSGKSTSADYLCTRLNAIVRPFAKPIKDFAYALGWDGAKDKRGRRLLQLLGTEVGRECIGSEIWVNKWQASLDNTGSNVTIICDDLRFQNEYEHLDQLSRRMPVYVIHVIRPAEFTPLEKLVAWLTPRHKSEQGIKFNKDLKAIPVLNSGTVSQLQHKLEGVIDGLL